MAPRPEYIQLDEAEDIHSIRDRLSFIRAKHVLLIWPEKGQALERKIDLIMVQREARRRAIQIAFVSHDKLVRQHAKEIGISVFSTIGEAESKRWLRTKSRIFTKRHHKPFEEAGPEELMEVVSRVKSDRYKKNRTRIWIERLALLAFTFMIISGTFIIVTPQASIEIPLYQESISIQTELIADPNAQDINIETGIIPATILRVNVETSGTISTTGQQEVSAVVASGSVVFTNQTETEIVVPVGTTISTSAGSPILFTTTQEVIVPAGNGERMDATIEAIQSSNIEAGNVQAGMINTIIGPLEDRLTVRNINPTTGGGQQTVAMVSQNDIDSLLATVRQELQAMAYEEMQLNLNESQLIVIESIRIPPDGERNDWITFSHELGDFTDTISLTMRVVVEAIAIDDRFGQQVAFAKLSSQKPADLLIVPDSLSYSRGNLIAIDAVNQSVRFEASAEGLVRADYDIEALRGLLVGMDSASVPALIARQVRLAEGQMPMIEITPGWFNRMPFLPFRIQIKALSS